MGRGELAHNTTYFNLASKFSTLEPGYSPEDVFNLFFPPNFRFLCNPHRPAVCGRFGTPAERLWRFEFVVRPGEDGNELATPAKLKEILYPYLTHPGTCYGLQTEVAYPLDCVKTLRSRPFFFSARTCNKWSLERVILSGDSAHVFPPFGGQGLASGFRDACSLAWRLKVACQSGFKPYERLFEGWYKERKDQLDKSLAATIENGRYVTEGNPFKILFRDTYLWMVQPIPWWKRELEKGARRHGMCRYQYDPGMHFICQLDGGLLLPQVYCSPLDITTSTKPGECISFTDDEIFSPTKQGLFQLVAVVNSSGEFPGAYEELQKIERYSNHYIVVSEATVVVMDPQAKSSAVAAARYRTVRVATADEFAMSPLCKNRPPPKYYDEYRIAAGVPGSKYIIVRPDRFVFAACRTRDGLVYALGQMESVLHGKTM